MKVGFSHWGMDSRGEINPWSVGEKVTRGKDMAEE